MTTAPHVFLSHASEDDVLALRLGTDFLAAGIDTFLDKWDLAAGQSIRQRIDQGLACTHVLVLLTPQSIAKPWVNAEIDAAFVQKMLGKCELIPVRHSLPHSVLSPLLAALYSPAIDDYDVSVPSLIADIYGVSSKPQKGPPPSFTKALLSPETGLSESARQVALVLLTRSQHGLYNDPRIDLGLLKAETYLPDENLADGAFELEDLGYVCLRRSVNSGPPGFDRVCATDQLFVALDRFAMSWDTEVDALTIASRLVAASGGGLAVAPLAQELCWSTRRINPAVGYLEHNDLVKVSQTISDPYVRNFVYPNERTRRWLKQNR